jgi:anti-sigma factor RsiW
MTCDEVQGLIDDYVDGALAGAELHGVELHLSSCAACREEERQIRALVARASALPRERTPARDLWPGIAARLDEQRDSHAPWVRARRFFLSRPAGLAAAAAVVLAVLSALVGHPSGGGTVPTPTGSIETVSTAGTPAPVLAAETDYVRATGQLMEALNGRRSGLSPETVKAVDDNLRTIDDALRQIRVALDKDPGNRQLSKMLASTHQKKLDLLLRLLKLTSQI